MKLLKRISVMLLVGIMFICVNSISVFAATTEKDGLTIEFISDKSQYSASDTINVTLSVKNNNKAQVDNVVLENVIPNGYKLADNSLNKKTVNNIATGNSESLTTSFIKPKDNEPAKIIEGNVNTDGSVPPTGENDKILYTLLLVVVVSFFTTVVCLRNKKGKQLLSILLCIVIAGTMIPVTSSFVSATTSNQKASIIQDVTVDGQTLQLVANISYDLITADKENLTINLNGMLYDNESHIYYQPDEMTKLTGTLENVFNVKKATCTVKDTNGKVLLNKDFEADKQWTVDGFAMIVGENTVMISIEYADGTKDEKTVLINNINEKNMDSLTVDKGDSDNDGVLNFIEELYHTNINKADSDDDGLSDYYEMGVLGTDPNKKDSDGNGIADADEDFDNDGLTNIDEIKKYNTDPTCVDSDGDTISDSDEIKKYKTDPNKADSDGDKVSDGWEIENGYDPVVPNTDFPEESSTSFDGIEVDSAVPVELTSVENEFFLNPSTPGYIGVDPVHVDIEDGKTAILTFEYDPSIFSEGEKPVLYRFNEDTQKLEEIKSIVVEDGKMQAEVGAGDYILLNHRVVDDVWENDIYQTKDNENDGDISIAFVVDRSASMDDNDPDSLRKAVIKKFLKRLRPGKDKATLIQFTAIAETIVPLTDITDDNSVFEEALDAMENSDGGGCAGSDQNAGTNGAAGLRYALNEIESSASPNKYIIFLTDGKDSEATSDREYFNTYDDVIRDANTNNIIIYTVGLVGTGDVDIDLLKKVAKETNGKYYLATAGVEPEIKPEEDVFSLEEIYDEIAGEIDKESDYNKDGITDYLTKLLCENKLTTSTGKKDFFNGKSFDEVQNGGSDLDGDGLKNGEELEVKIEDNKLYVKFNSDPTVADSDNDGLSDYDEIKIYGTSALKYNTNAWKVDVDLVTNNKYYQSNQYRERYNTDALFKGSVFIGNAFYGTTINQEVFYETVLSDYFTDLNKEIFDKTRLQNYQAMASAVTEEIFKEDFQKCFEAIEDKKNTETLKETIQEMIEKL